MIIDSIIVKNLKSYGNDPQEISLDNDGNLILLSGRNGAGKSAMMDGFDYVLYNRVKGKKSKKVKLSSLPNRINKNLEVDINFTSIDGTKVRVIRGYAPAKLTLYENGIENKRAGKDKINKLIEDYIGIDYDTFKGFISMSINDFKNFISLSNEEKKLLLDKLFNLEVINNLNKILNDLVRENKKEIDIYEREIDIINDNIENIDTSIEKVKLNKKDNLSDKVISLKSQIENKRKPFSEVKEKLELVKSKQKSISDDILLERTNLIQVQSDIKNAQKELKLYENDKCPTCQGDLDSGFHKGMKESFEEKLKKLQKVEVEVRKKGSLLKEKEIKLNKLYEKGNSKYSDLNSTLMSLKREYDGLLKKQKDSEVDEDLEEFYKSINILKEKLIVSETNKSESSDKIIYHKHIKSILSENGVKKNIIQNIVDPINHYISENVQKMHLPFEVVLDDTFTANITSFGEEIDIDTLSTGETRKLNIAIMIAYLKLVRTKRQVNILFLDEVFSSVDVESINDVVSLLRDLAENSKINIFLVHHSLLDSDYFDRILKVQKDVFSYIEEVV